jgi:hypothetical protein
MFSWSVKQAASALYQFNFLQYALLGRILQPLEMDEPKDKFDPVFLHKHSPWSAFIRGQQGSGKSYTMSCMLEGCLLAFPNIGKLPKPLTGIVFNYDSQAEEVCEAAYLCSAGVKVTVLVSPSNLGRMEELYGKIPGASHYLEVKPLFLKPEYLNTERMKRLMVVGNNDNSPPLYMYSIFKVRMTSCSSYEKSTNLFIDLEGNGTRTPGKETLRL